MKYTAFLLAILLLASLACSRPADTVAPTVTHTATVPPVEIKKILATKASPTLDTATVLQAVVTVRDAPNGDPTGDYLTAGQSVDVLFCTDYWCQIVEPAGWVYRGCLTISNGLGCRAK